MAPATAKHFLHCFLFGFITILGQWCHLTARPESTIPITDHGYVLAILFYILELLPLLNLPYMLETALGLLLFNAFEDKVTLSHPHQKAPFICFRIVTRGDFPELVMRNVERNRTICSEAGLEHFLLEVVTDKAVGVPKSPQTKEVVVPAAYHPRNGAMYKARALQYCLEEGVNSLADEDWIVHLDEETLLTQNVIHGILNFIGRGRHQIGQGLVTYVDENIVNWFTSMIDCARVADDMGRLRLELKVWHRPLFGFKGSFIVVQAGTERKVAFDHGLVGSLLEDNYFSMHAVTQGYSFDFIEGEMWEQSPFTMTDLVQQRKRWVLGYKSLAHDSSLPIRHRCFYLMIFYAIAFLPVSLMATIFARLYHLENLWLMEAITVFMYITTIYMHVYGVLKSFSIAQVGLSKYLLTLFGGILSGPINFAIPSCLTLLSIAGKTPSFYIVNKDYKNIPAGMISSSSLKDC